MDINFQFYGLTDYERPMRRVFTEHGMTWRMCAVYLNGRLSYYAAIPLD